MATNSATHGDDRLPSLSELGVDLVHLSAARRWLSIAVPVLCVVAYLVFACLRLWPLAILSIAAYTFYSYGSTSHDLVHGNLGLPRPLNNILLSFIELLGLRSGHAYRAAHLHHHAHFPDHDDVEATAAHHSLLWALAIGPIHQFQVWWWALRHARHDRPWIVFEALACVSFVVVSIFVWHVTLIPLAYAALVIAGSWTFPLVTAYLPHVPDGAGPLEQTRRFRGKVAAIVFQQHLYHLEHHLYPMVPHQHWHRLAKRLDPHLDRAGIKSIHFGF